MAPPDIQGYLYMHAEDGLEWKQAEASSSRTATSAWVRMYFCLHGQELSWYTSRAKYEILAGDVGVYMSSKLVRGKAIVLSSQQLRDPRTPSPNGLLLTVRADIAAKGSSAVGASADEEVCKMVARRKAKTEL